MATILVVDDDADTCCNMADLFGDLGYTVDTADGGLMALEKACRQPYQLGLLDQRMPDMDGLTLCCRLKHVQPRMVTMLVTACGGLEQEARLAGARHVLRKPIDFTKLAAFVEEELVRPPRTPPLSQRSPRHDLAVEEGL